MQNMLGEAFGGKVPAVFDLRTDRNIEFATTLLADMRASAVFGIVTDVAVLGCSCRPGRSRTPARWLADWPNLEPAAALAFLGLDLDASLRAVLEAVYALFEDHWAAGVVYQLGTMLRRR